MFLWQGGILKKNRPTMRKLILITVRIDFHQLDHQRPLLSCKYANPQKMNPKNESKRDDIKPTMSGLSDRGDTQEIIEEWNYTRDDESKDP
jgi:hypothetical protein